MTSRLSTAAAVLLTLGSAGVASAQALETEKPASNLNNMAAITISPIHLAFPVFEMQVEVYLSQRMTLSLIGGLGSVTVEDSLGESQTFDVWEIGGQFRGYFSSAQEGFFAGAEVLKLGVSGNDSGVTGTGEGLELAAIAGYKWVWDWGLVLDLNGGVGHVSASAEATDGSTSDSEDESGVIPVLNFNVGYAF